MSPEIRSATGLRAKKGVLSCLLNPKNNPSIHTSTNGTGVTISTVFYEDAFRKFGPSTADRSNSTSSSHRINVIEFMFGFV